MTVIDLRDPQPADPLPRTPVRLDDEIARAAALVIHALALGSVALVGALVAHAVQILT